jgi:acyl carrier protein
MDRSKISAKVRAFVVSNFYVAVATALSDEASLLDQGVIDSTGVLEVVGFLEQEFGVQVADEEMVPDNLDSISRITAYVERKSKG